MSDSPLRIIELRAANVKRLRAVTIRPDGNVVVLGGKNGAGKSSVLDAITYALAGERAICAEPLRRGEKKGEVDIDLGEFRVRRTFTEGGGGTLSVLSKDGARFPSPQAMLDRVYGRLSFDPLSFAGMEADRQAETLRGLLGLDFAALDRERAKVYADRTTVNRDGAAIRARYDAASHYPDAPAVEVSAADILAEQAKVTDAHSRRVAAARERNRANAAKRKDAQDADRLATAATSDAERAESGLAQTLEQIRRLQALAAEQEADAKAKRATAADLAAKAAAAHDAVRALTDEDPEAPDLTQFADRLVEVEAINRRVRANADRAALGAVLDAKRAESAALTARLDAIDREKADAIAAAKMPVEGLGFDPVTGGVTFGGLPLEQASHAERLRVSVAIGLAMNPRLKVLLIRDASLLDEDGMRLVAEMAEAAGAQFWLERVGSDEDTTVLIEDGAVAPTNTPTPTPERTA